MYCCETAGFTWVYEMNRLERLSLNECIFNAGIQNAKETVSKSEKVTP
jgi:hypothetical protein